MATVQADIIGGTLGYGADGYYATRIFQVTGLSGNADSLLYEALQHGDIPQRGELHPVANMGLPVDDMRAESIPHSPSKAKVTVTYKAPRAGTSDLEVGQEPQISVSTGLQQIESHFGADGKQIVTKHGDEEVAATISLNVPVASILYRRRELASDLLDPRAYIGHVNRETDFDGGARSWLCSQMDKETTDGGLTYIVTYGFQWKAPYDLKTADGTSITTDVAGWDMYVIEFDAKGNPVKDPILGEGIKIVQVYPTAAFTDFDLTYETGQGYGKPHPPHGR